MDMNKNEAFVLVKSEMKSQKKKMIGAGIVAIVAILVVIVSCLVKYSKYKDAQKAGIKACEIVGLVGSGTYEEKCNVAYQKLMKNSPYTTRSGFYYGGTYVPGVDNYGIRSSHSSLLESLGYDGKFDGDVANYYKYAGFFKFFSGYYWHRVLPIACYVVILFAVAFLFDVLIGSKKEIIIYEDSVLFKTSKKSTKEVVFGDISNVDITGNKLRILGTGFNFQISNLLNADVIRTKILEKKNGNLRSSNVFNTSTSYNSAEELKKYKDLYDSGVISKEEFETKKKQLLGM